MGEQERHLWERIRKLESQLTAAKEEIKEYHEALDNSDRYLHEALDRLGVPSSKRFPGQARDGVIARVEDAVVKLRDALAIVVEGKGRFSLDHLQHCRNTVEDMKEVAKQAIAESGGK